MNNARRLLRMRMHLSTARTEYRALLCMFWFRSAGRDFALYITREHVSAALTNLPRGHP